MATAVYWRHFKRYEEDFPSVDEAIQFLAWSGDAGALASVEVRDGERVIKGKELSDLTFDVVTANDASS